MTVKCGSQARPYPQRRTASLSQITYRTEQGTVSFNPPSSRLYPVLRIRISLRLSRYTVRRARPKYRDSLSKSRRSQPYQLNGSAQPKHLDSPVVSPVSEGIERSVRGGPRLGEEVGSAIRPGNSKSGREMRQGMNAASSIRKCPIFGRGKRRKCGNLMRQAWTPEIW